MLRQADSFSFGHPESSRPVIILDTSAAVGEALSMIRVALKKMLYSFLVTKTKFNFICFCPQGRAFAFHSEMVPPLAQRLREAEDWLDNLRPVPCAGPLGGGPDLLEALRLAFAAGDQVDSVYLLTTGLSKRLHAERWLAEVRAGNVHGVPIHAIGIDSDAQAEVELRRLAEDSGGSSRQKRFNLQMPATSPADLRRPPSRPSRSSAEEVKMTISGQMDILDIMNQEEEAQSTTWIQEQQCANRVLLCTATQQPVLDEQEVKAAALRAEASSGRSTLQELVQNSRSHFASPARAHAQHVAAHLGPSPPRRGTDPLVAGSAALGKRAASQVAERKLPTMASPCEQPRRRQGAEVIRVSELKQAASTAAVGPCHASTRSGPRRACSARRTMPQTQPRFN